MAAMSDLKILADKTLLAQAAAGHIVDLANRAIFSQGSFSLALAGGSTPRMVYSLLAEEALDWERTHLFWGDERCVKPEHPDSNFRMVREALLDHIQIPEQNVHRMRADLPPEKAAGDYESELRAHFKGQFRIDDQYTFDLILLGMGEDGHTASLFPGTPALEESQRWVAVVEHDQPPPPLVTRISLTLPVINAARQVTFLVSGANKAARLKQVFMTPPSPQSTLPIQHVQPLNGSVRWFLDQDAAGK